MKRAFIFVLLPILGCSNGLTEAYWDTAEGKNSLKELDAGRHFAKKFETEAYTGDHPILKALFDAVYTRDHSTFASSGYPHLSKVAQACDDRSYSPFKVEVIPGYDAMWVYIRGVCLKDGDVLSAHVTVPVKDYRYPQDPDSSLDANEIRETYTSFFLQRKSPNDRLVVYADSLMARVSSLVSLFMAKENAIHAIVPSEDVGDLMADDVEPASVTYQLNARVMHLSEMYQKASFALALLADEFGNANSIATPWEVHRLVQTSPFLILTTHGRILPGDVSAGDPADDEVQISARGIFSGVLSVQSVLTEGKLEAYADAGIAPLLMP